MWRRCGTTLPLELAELQVPDSRKPGIMDIKREPQKNRKKWILGGIGVFALAGVTIALMRLQPAAPSVERSTIYPDTVRRGEMVLEVRGPGTLVPEDIRWITAV